QQRWRTLFHFNGFIPDNPNIHPGVDSRSNDSSAETDVLIVGTGPAGSYSLHSWRPSPIFPCVSSIGSRDRWSWGTPAASCVGRSRRSRLSASPTGSFAKPMGSVRQPSGVQTTAIQHGSYAPVGWMTFPKE